MKWHTRRLYVAQHLNDTYEVELAADDYVATRVTLSGERITLGRFPTVESAKAACEADAESRRG